MQEGILQGGGYTQESVNNQSVSFTGTINGSSVTLSLNQGLGSTENLTGTLTSNQLTLNFPGQDGNVITLHLQPGTASDYDHDLNVLKNQARQANAQAQQAQAAQQQSAQVNQEAQAVQSALSALQADVKTVSTANYYSADLEAEQRDLAQTRTDMQHVLNEEGKISSGTLCSDAGTVQSDVGAVQSDVGAIQSDDGASESDIYNVKSDLSQLGQADQALQSDRQSSPGDVPVNAPAQAVVVSAVQAANAAISTARQNATAARSQARQMKKTAASYRAKSNAACRAVGGY